MKQKVLDILLRREYDYHPNHMRELLHNLYSPENVTYNSLSVQSVAPNLISLDLHPKQCNALLSHTISHGVYCGDINKEISLIPAENFDTVVQSQWYPFDTGMFSRVIEKKKWQLVDTDSFSEAMSVQGDFTHFDWNPVNVTQLALVENNLIKFVDLAFGGALSSLIPKSRHLCKLSRVAWNPTDGKGLFISNSEGRIFYYDTRILRRPVAKTPTPDRNFRATIMSMQVSPEGSQLITVSNEIIQWDLKLKQNTDKMIQNSNIHFEAKFIDSDPMFWLVNLMQPFITTRWIYLGNKNQINWSDDIIAFDRKTGKIGRRLYSGIQFLSNLEDYTNCIVGVGRTKYEDETNPQLIYIKNNCGIICSKLLDIDRQEVVSKSTQNPTNESEMDDRWSDDDM